MKWDNISLQMKKAIMTNLIFRKMQPLYKEVEENNKNLPENDYLNAKKNFFKNNLLKIQ